ncbi:hypothetical protein ACWKSP_38050 [Micromonosporaceae bacterium Da 78-11]
MADVNKALYENAMRVVPVLLIALFLDTRSPDRRKSRLARWWEDAQDRLFALLGVAAFMDSMLVVAAVVDDGQATAAIVIAALSGCIGLLLAKIWHRFARGGDVRD